MDPVYYIFKAVVALKTSAYNKAKLCTKRIPPKLGWIFYMLKSLLYVNVR